ncbi:GntR family transcriptional regulator [Roseomonas sp. HJA6]|uniref:GntR family transcriptional regulator n=1 Tax=Roseomonas alba TaxID=2846776 RepID=A0ABS7AG74_9PROT|nr:GntR family transcriptional regulator [Neoroseomonas alba]MBW6401302.1 GntR family transcriptional regulator [Neoroseomonas alba]
MEIASSLAQITARRSAHTRSIPDIVAETLREGILTGLLPAGMQLKQDHLARHFGTSRAPVREALQILAGEGLLTVSRHRGIAVAEADAADLQEIAEMRAMLEGHALKLSAMRLTEGDLGEAASILDEAEATPADPLRQSDLHWRFHRLLMARAERPRILAQVDHLHIAISRYLLPAWTEVGLSGDWVASHRALLALLRRGEAVEAAAMNARQIEEARTRVSAWLAQKEKTG